MIHPTKILISIGCLLMVSCAPTSKTLLDKKMANESAISSRADLSNETEKYIKNYGNLSENQKSKLLGMRAEISNRMNQLGKQSLELRAVLMKEVLSENYNSSNLGQIKERMKKVDQDRLATIFEAVEKTNAILGRREPLRARVVEEFLEGNRESN